MRIYIPYLLAAGLLFMSSGYERALNAEQPVAGAITPEPIPPGFDFPANRDKLQALVDANDITAMRTHSWNVWAGLTTDSKSTFRGDTLPVWETWLAQAQVFTDPRTKQPAPLTAPARMFVPPAQFGHTGLPVTDEENLLVGFNKFDPEMVTYLLTVHPGPGEQDYYYTRRGRCREIQVMEDVARASA